MEIKPPDAAEFNDLAARFDYRHPEKRQLSMPGDGGRPVSIPLVIGNPIGACTLPAGEKSTRAWNDVIAIALSLKEDDGVASDRLVEECVLWPDRKTYRELIQRWPALPVSLLTVARNKYGGGADVISEPSYDEGMPPPVAAALAEKPRATVRLLQFRSVAYALAIEPPEAMAWRLFKEAANKTGANIVQLASEIATASVVAAADVATNKPIEFSTIADRWPGVVIAVVSVISRLAGGAAAEEQVSF